MKIFAEGRDRGECFYKIVDCSLDEPIERSQKFFSTMPVNNAVSGGIIVLCKTEKVTLNGKFHIQMDFTPEEIMLLARKLLKDLPFADAIKLLNGESLPVATETEEAEAA